MSVALVSDAAFLAALGTARSIRLCAYTLSAGSAVVAALDAAADRGARVDVLLDGAPYHSAPAIARANAATSAELMRHGANVVLTTARDPALHLKAALVDRKAYLDDRNWASADKDTIVVLDDAAQVAALASAFAGRPVSDALFATEKSAALKLEAETIYQAPGDRIDVETESFAATAVSKALEIRAAHGTRVRLLVSAAELRGTAGARERRVLAKLAAAGVTIRACPNTEKLCAAGGQVWIGSANATFSPGTTLDWGLRSRDPAIVAGASRAFERNWSSGRPPSIV